MALMAVEESNLNVLPTNDFIFKMIFCDPKHSGLQVSLLNDIIKPESPIKNLEISSL